MNNGKKFTLGKNERLKSRKHIERLFKDGRHSNIFPFRISYVIEEYLPVGTLSRSQLLFGTGVSVRNFKRAIDRNRIKRLTREAWRLQKNTLQEWLTKNNKQLAIFFVYTSKDLPEYNLIFGKIEIVITKLMMAINENNPARS